MRYTLLLISVICTTILFTANTSIQEGFFAQFAFLGGDEVPELPEVPFNYEPNNLPHHLFNSSGGSSSWSSNTDFSAFEHVTDQGATLGRVLFYDEKLSANDNIACATCHAQEKSFADEAPFSMGVSTETDVNSMHLNDLAWTNNAGFFWDMSEVDLKEMIALPLENPNEIGLTNAEALIDKLSGTSYYPELFNSAFGSSDITEEKIRDAISQFILSMTSFGSKFDRSSMGLVSLNATEFAGEQLFIEHCSICHTDGSSIFLNSPININGGSSAIFLAPFLFDNGLPLEEEDIGAGAWLDDFKGLFKVPTLRNIEKTGPYMHDGRFETLEEVIDHYSDDISETVTEWNSPEPLPVGGLDFEETEKAQLLAFLKTLTDHSFIKNPKFSDPFIRSVEEENEEEEIEEEEEEEFVTRNTSIVYPNPTLGPLNIGFENINKRLIDVYLMDMEGNIKRKMSSHKNGLSTDLSLLPKGVYIVRVMKSEKVWEDHQVVLN